MFLMSFLDTSDGALPRLIESSQVVVCDSGQIFLNNERRKHVHSPNYIKKMYFLNLHSVSLEFCRLLRLDV